MKEKKKIERRCVQGVEVRAVGGDGSRMVEGYAAVFNTDSEDMGFIERIAPGAFDSVIEKSDVFALLNHDDNRGVLARSKNGKGSLSLEIDENGLLYRFEAPHTALGEELMENLKRGEIDSSSFAFTVLEDEWQHTEDDKYIRTIIKIDRLYDVSPVYQPAYSDTTCDMRGLERIKQQEADAKASAIRILQLQELEKMENKI